MVLSPFRGLNSIKLSRIAQCKALSMNYRVVGNSSQCKGRFGYA